MRFSVWMDGSGLDGEVEADDADEAAELAAKADYESNCEPPRSHHYDITVMAPDEAAVSALRAERTREATRSTP